jgi:hypothetical protein
MPSIDINFLHQLKDNFKDYKTFIETGTYIGDTIFGMEQHFNKLYTIELSDFYYNNTKKSYTGNKINFLLGDSSKVFPLILSDIDDNAIFFLDGHWSSGDTGKGDKDCPLLEEVSHINHMFKNKAILIVDDCRLFGRGPINGLNEDWTDINSDKILNILKDRTSQFYYLDSECSREDRLIIHINSIL